MKKCNKKYYLNNAISTFNGCCYKNYNIFRKHPNKVCYVSEYELLDIENDKHHGQKVGYTRKDIENVLSEFEIDLKYIDIFFDILDWQSPESFANEWDDCDYGKLERQPEM